MDVAHVVVLSANKIHFASRALAHWLTWCDFWVSLSREPLGLHLLWLRMALATVLGRSVAQQVGERHRPEQKRVSAEQMQDSEQSN